MTPGRTSTFQAVSLMKPDVVSPVMLDLFSASLLLWTIWVLNDACRSVATARVSWQALGSIGRRTILLLLISFWLVLGWQISGSIMRKRLLGLLLWFLALSVYADLPEMEDPSRGQGDDIMETSQSYGYGIAILVTLGICAVGFPMVVNNCIVTYSEIQGGRKQQKDLGTMAGVGAVLLVITIWLLDQALDTLQAMSIISSLPGRPSRELAAFRGLTINELPIVPLVGLATGAIAGTILAVL